MRALLIALVAVFGFSVAFANGPESIEKNKKVEQLSSNIFKVTYFHDNGEVREVGFYKDNQMYGEWNTFNEDGQLIAEGFFNENKKVGTWKFYNAAGIEIGAVQFVDDIRADVLTVK